MIKFESWRFIAGVKIDDGCVVLARSTVLIDLPAWKVVGGYPAKIIKDRILRSEKYKFKFYSNIV